MTEPFLHFGNVGLVIERIIRKCPAVEPRLLHPMFLFNTHEAVQKENVLTIAWTKEKGKYGGELPVARTPYKVIHRIGAANRQPEVIHSQSEYVDGQARYHDEPTGSKIAIGDLE